jgi:3-oxoacyl-[acyl-carrier protein] reductase
VPLDLCDEQAIRALPERLGSDFERVCVLVNNAGISPKVDGKAPGVLAIKLEGWNAVLQVNLTAPLLMSQVCLPPMLRRGWGRIVNISSVGGKTTTGLAAASYTASKSGLLGLTRSVAMEVSARGVTVNAVCPGRIETPMAGQAVPQINAEALKRTPVGRFGTPQEVADLVSFLASERSGFITGAALDINGGMLMV